MEVSWIALFLGGIASFISPCVLPLVPAYIFYLAGKNAKDIDKPDARLISNGVAFILGFSAVFMLLGATATALGKYLLENKQAIKLVSGIVIIFFGILQTGIIKLNFFSGERRFQYTAKAGLVSSFVMGAAFGFGWTPCISYTLMPALLVAANQQTVWQGVGMLGIYSLGFALPFLIISIFLKYTFKWIESLKKYMGIIKIISGVIIVLMGIAILAGWI
jgi:cytochrome c-type biogenesis protein